MKKPPKKMGELIKEARRAVKRGERLVKARKEQSRKQKEYVEKYDGFKMLDSN